MSKKIVLKLDHIRKEYHQGDEDLKVLQDVSLDIKEGEIVSIVGPSGCGKSTLLHIAGLLDRADKGELTIAGKKCTKARDRAKAKIRSKQLGFVYQYHHLMSEFSAVENVMLPQIIAGTSKKKAHKVAEELLVQFGLKERLTHWPTELSGGEQQRVAIARALANSPKLLLADEPTGNLDPKTADDVFEVMLKQVKKRKLAVLIVTHNPELAARADRMMQLDNGVLIKN